VKVCVPPDIKRNSKNQDEAGDKDYLKNERGPSKDSLHSISSKNLNDFLKMSNHLKGILTIYTSLLPKNQ
jgi:hypothetical protein